MTAYEKLAAKPGNRLIASYGDEHYDGLEKPIVKLARIDGQTAFVWVSDLDLDTDGIRVVGVRYDADHQNQTSADPAGRWLDSLEVAYYVVPGRFPHSIPLGTLATIFYNGGHYHAFNADTGPRRKIGEGSGRLHAGLGHPILRGGRILNEGIDGGVTTLVHIGHTVPLDSSGNVLPIDNSEIQRLGAAYFAGWL